MSEVDHSAGTCPLCDGPTDIAFTKSFPFPEEQISTVTVECARCGYKIMPERDSTNATTSFDQSVKDGLEGDRIALLVNNLLAANETFLTATVNALNPNDAILIWQALEQETTQKWVSAAETGRRNYESSVTPNMGSAARAASADYYDNEVSSAPEPTLEDDPEKIAAISRVRTALRARFGPKSEVTVVVSRWLTREEAGYRESGEGTSLSYHQDKCRSCGSSNVESIFVRIGMQGEQNHYLDCKDCKSSELLGMEY